MESILGAAGRALSLIIAVSGSFLHSCYLMLGEWTGESSRNWSQKRCEKKVSPQRRVLRILIRGQLGGP